MPKYCTRCGNSLQESQVFCEKCGAPAPYAAPSNQPLPSQPAAFQVAQYQPVQPPPAQAYAPVPPSAAVQPMPPAPAKGGSVVLKIVLVFLVLIFVGVAVLVGGIFYAAHRVSQKVHQIAAELPAAGDSPATVANACALLTAQDVSQAIGVEIVQTQQHGAGCTYMAKGDSATMTSKHLSAGMRAHGANSDQQKMVQGFSQALFQSSQHASDDAGTAETTPVLIFTVENGNAAMQASKKIFQGMGPGSQSLPGVGDEAFDIGGGTMMIRKGGKTIRIMYGTCPCNTQAVIPLAKKLASAV